MKSSSSLTSVVQAANQLHCIKIVHLIFSRVGKKKINHSEKGRKCIESKEKMDPEGKGSIFSSGDDLSEQVVCFCVSSNLVNKCCIA
jgi:hypothetical protein